MSSDLKVRFRVDFGSRFAVGVGKIELLEGIARSGSLTNAARDMRMSYRRAWLLLQDLNSSFVQPVATANVGGRGGGGVVLTAFGARLVAGYRRLEASVQPLAAACLGDIGGQLQRARSKRSVRSASIKRKTEPRKR